jgi:signal transduction histidine kinase
MKFKNLNHIILFKLFIIGIILNLNLTCKQTESLQLPEVKNGVLDLREFKNFDQSKINLDGEWLFSYGNLVLPIDETNLKTFHKAPVPSSWTKYIENYPSFGYGTYHLTIYLPSPPQNLSLKVYDMGTSYNLYLDGMLIGNKGKVGSEANDHQGELKSDIYDLNSNDSILQITFHISNYSHSRGGFWRSIYLAKRNQLIKERENNIALNLFLVGLFLLISIYNLSLYTFRPKERILLYFSIFSIIISIRVLLTEEKFIYNLIPSLSMEISLKLEYLALIGGIYSFSLFINHLFKEHSIYMMSLFFKVISILLGFSIAISNIWLSSKIIFLWEIVLIFLILYVIFISIKSLTNKIEGANLFIFGSSLLGISIINDLLLQKNILHTIPVSSFGFIIFNLCITIILSKKFSLGFIIAENLAHNLEISNKNLTYLKENLEKEIFDRTNELSHLNDFSRKINSMSNLNDILSEVKEYLIQNFNIHTFFLMLYDSEKKELFTYDFFSTKTIPDNIILYIKKIKITSADKAGIYLALSKNKSPLFQHSEIEDFFYINSNEKILKELKNYLTPITMFPLFNEEELVGILNIISEENHNKNNIDNSLALSRFINQFIGAIRIAYLTSKNITVKDKMAKIGEIASGIIHDLKNPLSAIKLYAELSENESTSIHKRREYLKTISTEIDRLSDMTQEILDYVKKDIIIEREEVRVDSLINTIYNFLLPDLEHQGIEVSLDIRYQDSIYIDVERIRRCILNILYNSMESFTESDARDKKISLTTKKIFNEVCFEIEDNGCGIPTEIKDKIYNNFFTFGKPQGTGIGLFLTKAIIENHNGRIEFESSVGLGTIFKFYLPL